MLLDGTTRPEFSQHLVKVLPDQSSGFKSSPTAGILKAIFAQIDSELIVKIRECAEHKDIANNLCKIKGLNADAFAVLYSSTTANLVKLVYFNGFALNDPYHVFPDVFINNWDAENNKFVKPTSKHSLAQEHIEVTLKNKFKILETYTNDSPDVEIEDLTDLSPSPPNNSTQEIQTAPLKKRLLSPIFH